MAYFEPIKKDEDKITLDFETAYREIIAENEKKFAFPSYKIEEDKEINKVSIPVEIDTLLQERGDNYGKFKDHASISQSLKDIMRKTKNWESLDPDQKETLEMCQHKFARLLNGDKDNLDSWIDAQGYLKLISDRLQGKSII